MTAAIGFSHEESEEIALAVSELTANLLKHATHGTLTLTPLVDGERSGIQIESADQGPGIPDVEQAMADGYSTSGSLGYGLGTVNRLMDEFDIDSALGVGTHIWCRRWLRVDKPVMSLCPLSFGAATRSHPKMGLNGDAFVIKEGHDSCLVGVIDGLGHGQWAHRAAQTARKYVESHSDQPLAEIFRGTGRTCRGTRGVVMTLARFSWMQEKLVFAAVGNVEARVFNSPEPVRFVIRRGIIGLNAPDAAVIEHHWAPDSILVMHSDGITTRWQWDDFPQVANEPATAAARRLLLALARDDDDATIIVVRGKPR